MDILTAQEWMTLLTEIQMQIRLALHPTQAMVSPTGRDFKQCPLDMNAV
jgi:hypothetical protein